MRKRASEHLWREDSRFKRRVRENQAQGKSEKAVVYKRRRSKGKETFRKQRKEEKKASEYRRVVKEYGEDPRESKRKGRMEQREQEEEERAEAKKHLERERRKSRGVEGGVRETASKNQTRKNKIIQERRKKAVILVVEEGERSEQGRGVERYDNKRKRRRSTHGRGSEIGEKNRRSYPLQSGRERGYRQLTREGERKQTKGNRMVVERKETELVGDKGAGLKGGNGREKGTQGSKRVGNQGRRTKIEGGIRKGWGTRRVPNRYDYYREGHRVNRMSKTMCKSSRESYIARGSKE